MPRLHPPFAMRLAIACVSMLIGHAAAADDKSPQAWPSTVVRIEDLKALTAFQLRVPGVVVKGRVTGPAVLRAHVNAQGEVTRVTLVESCGNGDLDEASIHALRSTKFAPHQVNGVPTEVTLVLPVHLPARLGRQH